MNPKSTFSSEELPARVSASRVSGKDSGTGEGPSPSRSAKSHAKNARAGSSGKTSMVSCHRTRGGRLVPSSGRWLTAGIVSPTGCWTRSFSVCPRAAERVFVVGHLGDTGTNRAEEVLFEREGGFGDAAAAPGLDEAPRAVEADGSAAVYLHIEGSTGERSHCLCASGTGRYNPTAETFMIYNLPERGAFDAALVDVRRLTPLEWERLQGFPDVYTLVPYRGKPACDGPRYTALGNSIAVPVLRWIGERIAEIDALCANRERVARENDGR